MCLHCFVDAPYCCVGRELAGWLVGRVYGLADWLANWLAERVRDSEPGQCRSRQARRWMDGYSLDKYRKLEACNWYPSLSLLLDIYQSMVNIANVLN